MKSYTHRKIGKEVKSISGTYTYIEENQLNYRGRNVVYAVGTGIFDTTCCGSGGSRFIEVPGYIVSWKSNKDEQGNDVSHVEPVEQENRQEIEAMLDKLYPNSLINFV